MTREMHHISGFVFGETVAFSFDAKNRGTSAADRTPLTSAGTQTIRMRVSQTPRGEALATYSTTSGNIILGDAASARFNIVIPPADYTGILKEGRLYFWEIESESTLGEKIGQKLGTITFVRSNGA